MKRRLYTIIITIMIIPALLLQSGCSLSGAIYETNRELEQLRLIQTMGLDSQTGGTVLTIAAGPGIGSQSKPIIMSVQAAGIPQAVSSLHDYAASEDLIYSHNKYIVLGALTARDDLEHYLDYIGRSPYMRLGMSLFVVRNGTAKDLITSTGGETYDITDVLSSLVRDAEKRGEVYPYTCGEVMRSMARRGAALAIALDIKDMSMISSESEGAGKTGLHVGYCILKDGSSAGYLTGRSAAAVGMIEGNTGELPVELPDGMGGITTVTLSGCKCETTPLWEGGELRGFELKFDLKASITELQDPDSISQAEGPEQLSRSLEATVCGWAEEIIARSCELQADFLGLGVMAQTDKPRAFAKISGSWPALLPELEFHISAKADIERSYDLTDPASVEGGERR